MNAEKRILVVGSINMDLVAEVTRPPVMGETVLANALHHLPGGKGANQAVAAARLGARVVFLGAVGSDPFAAPLIENLKTAGVATHRIRTVDGPSGIALITLARGDNQIIVYPGANHALKPEDVLQAEEEFKTAQVVLLQFEIPLPVVAQAARSAKAHGRRVIVNPAPAQAIPTEWFPYIDVLTPNREELATLSGMPVERPSDVVQAMRKLKAQGTRAIVTTLGEAGVAYLNADGEARFVPAYDVPVVDTTGAGDAFNGALAVALAEGRSLDASIAFANRVAALKVTRMGAQAGMPRREEVDGNFAWRTRRPAEDGSGSE